MKLNLNFNFINGFWGLSKRVLFNLLKLTPAYILIFIAYGDAFLPQPLANASYKTRTGINHVLLGTFMEKVVDNLENNEYNHKRIDKVSDETEKKY